MANYAKLERTLDSAGLPFSYEDQAVWVHLEGPTSVPPREARGLREAGYEFHAIHPKGHGNDVVFRETGTGGWL